MSATRSLVGRFAADARTRTGAFALLCFTVVWANAAGYRSTYPTVADRRQLVTTFADNKAARMLYGVGHDLTTVGGYTAWRAGGLLVLFAGLFGIFASTRAMRTEEDSGRAELVLAGALTRAGAFTASVAAVGLTIVGLLVATVLGAVAGGLPIAPSWFLGLAVSSVAAVYAAVGAVTNQLLPTRRSALGAAGALLGVDFLVRVVADTTDHYLLHWFAPLGWAEQLRAFTGTHTAVLALPIITTTVLVVAAGCLRLPRDVGGAYVAPHDAAPTDTRLLSSPLALALRLDRLTIASWAGAVAAFAFVIGTVAKSVEKLKLPDQLRAQLAKLGGIDLTRATGYVGLTFVIFVFVLALFVCGQLAAARDEESTHRLETLFALPYGRVQWLRGRIALIVGAVIACALAAGAGAGLGAVLTHGHMTFSQGLQAGVNLVPAELLFVGVGVLLIAVFPRHGVGVLYGVVVIAFVWELFGALLSFPNWMLDLSPFHHIAPAPAKPIALLSAAAMTLLGAIAAGAGVLRFTARDLAGD